MNLIDDKKSQLSFGDKIEVVHQTKVEYKHLGTFLRRRSLNLFFYDWMNDNFDSVNIIKGNTIHAIPKDGKLVAVDLELEKAIVDPRFIFFEALNKESAKARIDKYKSGRIKELCNLREPSKEGIKFW